MCGGKSAEHEISLISGMNILQAIDRTQFEVMLIGLDKDGRWFLQSEEVFLTKDPNPKTIALDDFSRPIGVIPGHAESPLFDLNAGKALPRPDVVFPILHGPNGEDGTMQGLLRQLGLPYVGPDVLGSAVAMDKDVAKRLLSWAGIPNSPFRCFQKYQRDEIQFDDLASELKLPFFVKPACMGSSVGISKVNNESEFNAALDLAFTYDWKILIEEGIVGREIECAVLGNEYVKGSVIGEIVPPDGFYDYESKYIDEDGAALLMPAPDMDDATVARVQDLAVKTFKVLGCEGLSRVDFFLCADGTLMVNEVNTLPGFTRISMYPSLWGISGIAYPELITELLELGMQRKMREDALKTSV